MSDGLPSELPVSWVDILPIIEAREPGFTQWLIQRNGGLPEGNVTRVDYERFKAEYEKGS